MCGLNAAIGVQLAAGGLIVCGSIAKRRSDVQLACGGPCRAQLYCEIFIVFGMCEWQFTT